MTPLAALRMYERWPMCGIPVQGVAMQGHSISLPQHIFPWQFPERKAEEKVQLRGRIVTFLLAEVSHMQYVRPFSSHIIPSKQTKKVSFRRDQTGPHEEIFAIFRSSSSSGLIYVTSFVMRHLK